MKPAVALENHPLAELVPAMDEEQFARLIDDIRQNGLLDPIVLYEGKILDGRHRYRACMELIETGAASDCVSVRFTDYDGDAPAQFVLSHNVARRHLTASQLAMVATDFLPYLKEEAKHGGDRRSEEFSTRAETRVGTWEDRDPSHEGVAGVAGKIVGVSGSSVRKAQRVAEASPEKAEEVRAGEKTVERAYREVRGEAEAADAPRDRSWKRNPADQIENIVTKVEIYTTPLGTRREGETKDQLIDVGAAIIASDEATLREWESKLTVTIQRLTRLRTGIKGGL